jgi:hypothetical protein
MDKLNVTREIKELKSQLSYAKNIGFFMGAGTSCALGLPNISQLTAMVEDSISEDSKASFCIVKSDLAAKSSPEVISIEDILNQVRRIREITGDLGDRDFLKVTGVSAKKLDIEICNKIYELIDTAENTADLSVHKRFLAWLNMQNRDSSKEIFTTNYDLVIEKALESIRVPYFDGFVGSYEPFFWQESVERLVNKNDLTNNWVRLWKIHGSLSWFWKENLENKSNKIIRQGKISKETAGQNEIVIYPSKEKYDSSRRQPFIVYFDRLKNYLLSGELLFIFSGYSFLDQHINEIIFNCLRQNNRLHVVVFFYSDIEVLRLQSLIVGYLNISVYGPKKAIINGVCGDWIFEDTDVIQKQSTDLYWQSDENNFLLGDFRKLVNFLVSNSGRSNEIEITANEN